MEQLNPLKRKLPPENEVDEKKSKLTVNILELSDCILLHILKLLNSTSLYQLSKTCTRFEYLTCDQHLWKYVEARDPPNSFDKSNFCERNIHEETTHVHIAGACRSDRLLVLDAIVAKDLGKNLVVLSLENQFINGDCHLNSFPESLRELSFKRSYISQYKEFFRYSHQSMLKLKVLILDHCKWLGAESLMSVSKFPELEILSLYMCKKLNDMSVSYISLSGYGFKNLKILDARFTGLGYHLIQSLYKLPKLQEFYLQGFLTTYRLEQAQRKLDIERGAKRKRFSYMSDDEDDNAQSLTDRFKHEAHSVSSMQHFLDDDAIVVYNFASPSNNPPAHPTSVLFQYPYEECKCGFSKKFWDLTSKPSPPASNGAASTHHCSSDSSSSSSDDEDDHKKLQRRVTDEKKRQKRILKQKPRLDCHLLKIKNDLTQTGPSSSNDCDLTWLNNRDPRNDFEIDLLENADLQFQDMGKNFQVIVADLTRQGPSNVQLAARVCSVGAIMRNRDALRGNQVTVHQYGEGGMFSIRIRRERFEVMLKKFSLRGYIYITDKTLRLLTHLKLELLDVTCTSVTKQGVYNFMIHNPQCRVIHESACICRPQLHF